MAVRLDPRSVRLPPPRAELLQLMAEAGYEATRQQFLETAGPGVFPGWEAAEEPLRERWISTAREMYAAMAKYLGAPSRPIPEGPPS